MKIAGFGLSGQKYMPVLQAVLAQKEGRAHGTAQSDREEMSATATAFAGAGKIDYRIQKLTLYCCPQGKDQAGQV
ncbi:hypothetical protein [Leisingera sp. ANG59]|uniref:hypothetical protein n=1 Tax=Leisingera sp. ANG59 TaxID=2675221 RepID=UPI001572E514|nr:hypothetical protein [Leisingera sp. ANG59]NSY38825.1 hypothetical protein [Leisingera sp. ANG59]